MMNAKELRDKSGTELNGEVLELRKAQFSLRMQLATQQLSNTSQLGRVRRDIARIKTVLHEKAGRP
jgi:large subunit ribosomal protein L29